MIRKNYRLFWTGGFDSTFRLVELSRRPVKISPVYIVFPDRPAVTPLELQAHQRILAYLKKRRETIAQMMPVRYVMWNQIVVSEAVKKAHDWVSHHFPFKIPHCDLLLAAYAEKSKGIEIGLEKYYDKPGRTFIALEEAGGLHFDSEGIGRLQDPNNEHPQLMLMHGNYGYSIANKREVDMWELLQKWGYQDISRLTQTCEHPYNGTPCGCCTNCWVKIHSAMGWYLGEKAMRRHQIMVSLHQQSVQLAREFQNYMMGLLPVLNSRDQEVHIRYFRSLLQQYHCD